jgi:hypothetical protein
MPSSRHHYLPEYYIKGFTNSDGLLYVYDKTKDKIIGQKPPKSIFFEWDRNTVSNGIEKNSLIEEMMYGTTDSYCSPAFKHYKEQENIQGIHNIEHLGRLKIFAVNLYWRLPVNDSIFESYWDFIKDKLSKEEKNLFRTIQNETAKKKLYRSNLDSQSIYIAAKKPNKEYYNKLFDFHDSNLVVSDNPIVYRTIPKTLDQIVYSDMAFAVSSSRLLFEMDQAGTLCPKESVYCYNAIVIDQAEKYVCSGDEDALKESISIYKKARTSQTIPLLREWLFEATYKPITR